MIENNNTNEDLSFSERYVKEKKEELALKILSLFGITDFDEKEYINFNDLNNQEILDKMREMIPALRTVFQISKNRSLSITSWDRSKHPGLNLIRQILKEIGYKLTLINEFKGTLDMEEEKKKKVYNTKYIIVKCDTKTRQEKKKELETIMANKKQEEVTLKKTNKPVIVAFN